MDPLGGELGLEKHTSLKKLMAHICAQFILYLTTVPPPPFPYSSDKYWGSCFLSNIWIKGKRAARNRLADKQRITRHHTVVKNTALINLKFSAKFCERVLYIFTRVGVCK